MGGPDEVDAYVDHALLDDVVERYRLRPSSDPNVMLRLVPAIGWDWPPTDVAPRPAVALDLLDHAEPRVRQLSGTYVQD